MRPVRLLGNVCVLLGVAVAGGVWGAQDGAPGADQPPPLVLRSTTRLVQVNVIVHHKGEPVSDLKKGDFELTDNGKPQEITQFSMDMAGTNTNVPASTSLPPGVFANRVEDRTGGQAGVTIILLDGLNTKWTDQAYARQQVIKFLQQVQPSDRIGLYTLGRGLRMLHDFTSDSSSLVRRLANYSGQNLADSTLSDGGDSLLLDGWLAGNEGSGPYADYYTSNRILGTLRTLEFIANHVAHVPGRKNLIWVSGGFPLSIGFDSIESFNDPGRMQRTFTEDIDRTLRALNNANMAVYPVDARGLQPDPHFSAEFRGNGRSVPQAQLPRHDNQETMIELASRTGGRAYYNTNDLKTAIRDAVSDTQVTYTIGYYPHDEKFDGRFHNLKVKVDRPGVEVRYRKGYFDLAEKPQDEQARKAELRDTVWSPLDATGLALTVKVVPTPGEPGRLQVAVAVDPRDVRLEHQDGRYDGRLDILFVQTDDNGKQYDGKADTIEMRLTEDHYKFAEQHGLRYDRLVARAPRAKQLKIVVRDGASGNIGSVSIPMDEIPQNR